MPTPLMLRMQTLPLWFLIAEMLLSAATGWELSWWRWICEWWRRRLVIFNKVGLVSGGTTRKAAPVEDVAAVGEPTDLVVGLELVETDGNTSL